MLDDEEPKEKMDTTDENEEFVEKTILINPNIIENHWQRGKKPLCYFKKWRHLHLNMKKYEFVWVYHSMTTGFGHELDDIIDERREVQKLEPRGDNEDEIAKGRTRREFRHLAQRARENFDALSEEEQSEFRWAHLSDVSPAEQHRKLGLVGWAEIEGSRAIKVFSVDKKDEADKIKYSKTFNWIRISIQELSEKDAVGQLMHWTEELRQYDNDDFGEDYLIAEIYVKEGMLAEIEQEIRQRSGDVPLALDVQAHLFQYEVDETLAEPYHYQTYEMIYDTPCSIILNYIRVGTEPKFEFDDDLDSYLDDEDREVAQYPDAQFRERLVGAASNLGASLTYIKIALWVMVALLLLSYLKN